MSARVEQTLLLLVRMVHLSSKTSLARQIGITGGRLEAYARLKETDVAVLVAEDFEELMIVTCNLRNEDSTIDWYLIQAQANTHEELYFHHIAETCDRCPNREATGR